MEKACFKNYVSHGREKIALIYVSKTQLKQVEYLIGQSIQGNHVLFDLDTVRKVFFKENLPLSSRLSDEEAYSVEHHIERLILQSSLAEKRAYLERLDEDTYIRVVRTYFNIVENNLYESTQVSH
jgi:hypothetical protein